MNQENSKKPMRIFMSHSSRDADKMVLLANRLEERGFTCWLAPRDIPMGNEFAEQLVKAIEDCDLMLVLLTEHSNNSQHVVREINHAVDRRKPILPVIIGDFPLSKSMQYYLSHTQWLVIPKNTPFETCLEDIENAISNPGVRKKVLEKRSDTRPRQKHLMLLLLSLAVVLTGFIFSSLALWRFLVTDSPETPSWTELEENALKEVLYFTGMHMTAFNGIFEDMEKVFLAAERYLGEEKGQHKWKELTKLIDHTSKNVTRFSESAKPLPDATINILRSTSLSVADISAMNSLLELVGTDALRAIANLQILLAPENPMQRSQQMELVWINRELNKENAKGVYYGVCHYLSPVLDTESVKKFRREVVPMWSFFDASYVSFWKETPEVLETALEHIWQKQNRLVTDLATLTGNMQTGLNNLLNVHDLLLEKILANWRGVDTYLVFLMNAVNDEVMTRIESAWTDPDGAAPSAEQYRNLCAEWCSKTSSAGEKFSSDTKDSDSLESLCAATRIAPEVVQLMHDAVANLKEQHALLVLHVCALQEAESQEDISRGFENIRDVKQGISIGAEFAHLAGFDVLVQFSEEFQQKALETLASFQILKPAYLLPAEELEQLNSDLMQRMRSRSGDMAEMETRIQQAQVDWENLKEAILEKGTIQKDDAPGTVIAKARWLRENGLIAESVAAFKQYGEMFGSMHSSNDGEQHLTPEITSAYVQAAIAFTNNIAEYNVDKGVFLFDFKGCDEAMPLAKYDILIRYNGQSISSTRALMEQFEEDQSAGINVSVTLLRMGENSTFVLHEVEFTPLLECLLGAIAI